ncbi:hypothetical protein TRIUR3_07201 [Triticum urartu]|uniref:KIB1-4 beta-propeller domain-containing protein n=1 Tax=Triticum urartu TaxID=4572 RepID=M7ZSC4_TRIUA|nr:hypothetical protein TRIUR3_07201 [Triticum urartu]
MSEKARKGYLNVGQPKHHTEAYSTSSATTEKLNHQSKMDDWVLLHGADDQEGRPLFLNVTTGSFRRLRRPVLGGCLFIGASDGLLVLGGKNFRLGLLNPLTGDMLHVVEPAVAGTEPTIIFSSPPLLCSVYCPLERGCDDAVYSANPTGQLDVVKVHDAALNEEGLFLLKSMVTYAGNVYVITSGGTLSKIVWTGGHWYVEQIIEIEDDYTASLVESAGKLLLVKEGSETIQVFSIDVRRKVLEPIKSLGSSALFLSRGNCMVVDADMLPSIKRNCIYSTLLTSHRLDRIYAWCDLSDGKKNFIAVPQVPGDCPGAESGTIYEGPLSLAQMACCYLHEKDLTAECQDAGLAADGISRSYSWAGLWAGGVAPGELLKTWWHFVCFVSPSNGVVPHGGDAVYSADPMGQLGAVKFHDAAYNEEDLFYLQSMVTCACNVYMLSAEGILYKIVWTGGHWHAERIMEVYVRHNGALVEFAGKLLLVTGELETVQVFSVDAKRKVLEPIKSIGSSALFLSHGKCLIDSMALTYDLSDGKRKYITSALGDGPGAQSRHEGPLSLAQVLLSHCSEVDAQQDRIRCQF